MVKILVVEDYASLQQMYAMALEHAGHKVETASNGREALEKAKHSKPDLILLDLLMPEMDGMKFLELYDLKKHPYTEVVVLSNLSSDEILRQTKALGVTHSLTKINFTPDQLVAYVKDLLSKKSSK